MGCNSAANDWQIEALRESPMMLLNGLARQHGLALGWI